MKKIAFILCSAMLLIACNNSSTDSTADDQKAEGNPKVAELKKEVLESHDVSMEQMSTIAKLSSQVEMITVTEDSVVAKRILSDLVLAEKSMMNWMHNFKSVDENDWGTPKKIQYLEAEKEKIDAIGAHMNKSIIEAREFLNKIGAS
jgi:hypothetical protein